MVRILNHESELFRAHWLDSNKCWPMAERLSDSNWVLLFALRFRFGWILVDWDRYVSCSWVGVVLCLIAFRTCCLMRSWSLWVVLPMYRLSQWHSCAKNQMQLRKLKWNWFCWKSLSNFAPNFAKNANNITLLQSQRQSLINSVRERLLYNHHAGIIDEWWERCNLKANFVWWHFMRHYEQMEME